MRAQPVAEEPYEPGTCREEDRVREEQAGDTADHRATFASSIEYEPLTYTCLIVRTDEKRTPSACGSVRYEITQSASRTSSTAIRGRSDVNVQKWISP